MCKNTHRNTETHTHTHSDEYSTVAFFFKMNIIFLSSGAKVILACRDITKAERAAQDIRQVTGNNSVCVRVVDLASFKSIKKFATEVIEKEKYLHILVNNAGR